MTGVKKINGSKANQFHFYRHIRKTLDTAVGVDFREQYLWEIKGREAGHRLKNSCSKKA